MSEIHGIKYFTREAIGNIRQLNRQNPNIKIFILYGLLFDTMLNAYRPMAVKFLERVGGQAFEISLFFSLPGLVAAIVLFPGSVFLSRLKSKKNVTSILFLLSRCLILSLAFIPLWPAHMRPLVFVMTIAAINLPESLAQASFQSILGTVFPGGQRAKAIALRNKFGNIMIPLVTLSTGVLITFAPRTQRHYIMCYQAIFVFSFLVGLAEIFVFRKFREEKAEEESNPTDFSIIKTVMRDKKFRSYLVLTIMFQFSWMAGWPLHNIFQIQYLGANEIWLASFTVASGLSAFLTAGLWPKIIRKHGDYKALFMATISMAISMTLVALCPNLPTLLLINFWSGFALIGVNTTILNGLLASTPDQNRIVYIGIYNTFANISLFISPLFSNLMLRHFGLSASLLVVAAMRAITSLNIYRKC